MTAPASSSTVNAPNASSSSNSIHANVVPSEVGWQFVPQYYTFMNKQPQRLHCFYTKNSTFIHGTEGEDGRPCYGQQEIHNKILSIGFQDCKVFIHSVDAQSSANGGIIIQVIGEMSNRGEPWRKFAQTFFLAEQPNGYFVLNDIFRFIKEESVEAEEEEASDTTNPTPSEPAPAYAPPAEPTPAQGADTAEPPAVPAAQAAQPTVAAVPFDAGLPDHLHSSHAPVAHAPEPGEPEPSAVVAVPAAEEKKTPQPNGIHPPAMPEPEVVHTPVVAPATVPPTEPPKQDPALAPPAAEAPVRPPTPASAPVPAPAPVAAPVAIPEPAPAVAPVVKPVPTPSPKPAAPKTWANLAAANSNKWGPQVAQEARGVSAAPPAPAPAPKQEPLPRAEKDVRDGGARELHPAHQAALSVATPQCFVKSVTEVISHAALMNTLTSRFGPIKELEIVRTKACAFLEFTTLDAARRAIVASLPVPAGGDGGVRIELEGGGSARISVETRKERGDRPPPRPRTGVPPGQERGGFRGGPGRGRGAGGAGGAGRGANKP